ncbi:hypothetical protein PCASD_26897 [Puccinia coronata f. sp. avenae]|uniref:VTT domain-containing protein n=1 Tax=Puccinia coronata f. sp. avenae TaxID=200324 RepID=A0A2N5RVH5_9BASI|nr:hypothetical protein PCASD_26897 [Puccinia coronata f. sp. avenae]
MSMSITLLRPIALLTGIVILSLLLLSLAIHSVPFLRLPTSLELIQTQIVHLREYSHSSTAHAIHLIAVISLLFISKQAFSIPGTALLNILIGSIYPSWLSTPLTCLLTAVGSTGAYLLARTSRPLIIKFIPKPLSLIQRAIDPFRIHGTTNRYHSAQLNSYLLIARFLPIVPYAALNLACGVLELPIIPFFWTLLVGSLPYNLLTTQLGDILRTASESSSPQEHPRLTEIWSMGLLFKLVSLSLLAILPVVFKDSLRNAIQSLSQLRNTPSAEVDQEWLVADEAEMDDDHHHHHHHHSKKEYNSLSPLICHAHPFSKQHLSRSNSESSLSSPDELIIHFQPPLPLPYSKLQHHHPAPHHHQHHHPIGLAIMNDHRPPSPLHLLRPSPTPTTPRPSLSDLPYRKVARLVSSPDHFTPFT